MENNDVIKEVRVANDIVSVISSYIPLIKKGKNYFGVCPFHDDTNPSMSVSEEKQIYKCFSCGASGNVYNFVMDYEKIDFKDALELLAKKAGITLNNYKSKQVNKNEKYYKMYDLADKFYQNNLNTTFGKEAKEYLKKRDITEEVIKTFRIGLSLKENDSLTKLLLQKDYNLKELSMYGLAYGDKDIFINRVMFPLFDVSGKVVGFSGRIYNMKSDSKYVNSKETPIFKKGELLYNYHLAKDEARIAKQIIIVEGFMDVIRLYTIGVKNVIALMGTALTKEQIILIKRLSNNVLLSLDGDEAGKKATSVVGVQLEKEGLNVKVVNLNDGLDPDEYIIKNGKNEFLSLIENPITFSDFKINYLKKDMDLTTIEDQSKYINIVIEELKTEKDDIKIELILEKLSREFDISMEMLKNKLQNLQKYSRIETFKKEIPAKIKLDKYHKATYAILHYMLSNSDVIRIYEKKLNYLPYPEARYLANEIIYFYKNEEEFNIADFLTTLTGKEELENLIKEINKEEYEELNSNSVIDEYIKVIKDYSSNQEIDRLKKLMEKESDDVKKAKIAEEIRMVKMGS